MKSILSCIFQQDQFVVDDLLDALYLDSLSNSHPVSVPVNNPYEINEIFDPISYSKVGILLMYLMLLIWTVCQTH